MKKQEGNHNVEQHTDTSKLELYEWGKSQRILEKPRLLKGKKISQIDCGGSHAAVLLEDGTVYTWGDGRDGQLGLGKDIKTVVDPTRVQGLPTVVQLWCGFAQTAVYTKTNQLYMWGYDAFDGPIFEPRENIEFANTRISKIAFGNTVTFALLYRQSFKEKVKSFVFGISDVKVWGISTQGLLGLGEAVTTQRSATSIPFLADKNVIKLTVGEFHAAACTSKGTIYVWGINQKNTLGTGEEGILTIPTLVKTLEKQYIVNALCGTNFTIAQTLEGALYSWGIGRHGVLGHGNEQDVEYPTRIRLEKVVGVATGGMHVVCWGENAIYSWGYGRTYKLGQNHENDLFSPTLIEVLSSNKKIVVDIKCGFYTTLALMEVNFLTITFQTSKRLIPVTKDMTFMDVLETMANFFGLDVKHSYLIDHNGNDYLSSSLIHDQRSKHSNKLILMRKRKLLEEACDELILLPDISSSSSSSNMIGDHEFPIVSKATIDKLVEWVTFHSNTGVHFRRVFETMYPTFINSHDLLEKLKERFIEPQMPIGIHTSMNKGVTRLIQLKVINFILKWVECDDLYDDLNVVGEINHFVEEHLMLKYPSEGTNIRTLIISKFETKFESVDQEELSLYDWGGNVENAPAPCLPLHSGEIDLFKYPPIEFARQITLIDHSEFFRKVKLKEIFHQNWAKNDRELLSPNLIQMIKRFNTIAEWVTAEILTSNSVAVRIKKVQTFIEIADYCYQFRNFNALMAILAAFNSSAIYRLKTVWGDTPGISFKHKQMLDELRAVVSLSSNMSKYREHISTSNPPLIPFIGIHLQDYTFTDDGNPTFEDLISYSNINNNNDSNININNTDKKNNGMNRFNSGNNRTSISSSSSSIQRLISGSNKLKKKKLINFSKFSKLYAIICVFTKFQTTPYPFVPIKPLLHHLLLIRGFQNHEVTAYKYSTYIEPSANALLKSSSSFLSSPSSSPSPSSPPMSDVSLPPLVLNEDISKLYHSNSGSITDSYQIRLLNHRSEIILGGRFTSNISSFPLTSCSSSSSSLMLSTNYDQSTPPTTLSSERASGKVFQHENFKMERSKFWNKIHSKLISSSSSSSSSSQPITDHSSSSTKEAFRDIVVASQFIETSIENILASYPEGNDDIMLLRDILSSCLYSFIDCGELMAVLKELSELRLLQSQRHTIAQLVGAYKDRYRSSDHRHSSDLSSMIDQLLTLDYSTIPRLTEEVMTMTMMKMNHSSSSSSSSLSPPVTNDVISTQFLMQKLDEHQRSNMEIMNETIKRLMSVIDQSTIAMNELQNPVFDDLSSSLSDQHQQIELNIRSLENEIDAIKEEYEEERSELLEKIDLITCHVSELREEDEELQLQLADLNRQIEEESQKSVFIEFQHRSEMYRLNEVVDGLKYAVEKEEQSLESYDVMKNSIRTLGTLSYQTVQMFNSELQQLTYHSNRISDSLLEIIQILNQIQRFIQIFITEFMRLVVTFQREQKTSSDFEKLREDRRVIVGHATVLSSLYNNHIVQLLNITKQSEKLSAEIAILEENMKLSESALSDLQQLKLH